MRTRRRELEGELEEQLAATTTAWPGDPAWLAAPELAAPGIVARTEAARSAQRQVGNRAVSRVLARNPNEKLVKAPMPPPPIRTGREVDVIFDTSPYLKGLVEPSCAR